jgi:hypothetical protein
VYFLFLKTLQKEIWRGRREYRQADSSHYGERFPGNDSADSANSALKPNSYMGDLAADPLMLLGSPFIGRRILKNPRFYLLKLC